MDERAKRLFETKGKRPEEIDPVHFAAKKTAGLSISGQDKKEQLKQKEMAALEADIYYMVELLSVSLQIPYL